jgi:hypothetical protein
MYRFVLLLPAAGAGLTGSKMARRVAGVDEFDFITIGENHNQGVSFYNFIFLLSCNKTFLNLIMICVSALSCMNFVSPFLYYHNILAHGLFVSN